MLWIGLGFGERAILPRPCCLELDPSFCCISQNSTSPIANKNAVDTRVCTHVEELADHQEFVNPCHNRLRDSLAALWQNWVISINILFNSSFAASDFFCPSKKTNFVADICLKPCLKRLSASEERRWAKPFWQQTLSSARCLVLWGFPFQGFSGDVPGSFSDPAFLSNCSAYADFASPPYVDYSPPVRFYILQASCVFRHRVGKYVGDDWDIPRCRSLGAR